jgi:putative endonuclease
MKKLPLASPCYVYMVRCRDGSLYTGITYNLERRIRQHNGELGGGAKYTKSRAPIELLYAEKYLTRREAARREYEIKHTLNHEQKLGLINMRKNDLML